MQPTSGGNHKLPRRIVKHSLVVSPNLRTYQQPIGWVPQRHTIVLLFCNLSTRGSECGETAYFGSTGFDTLQLSALFLDETGWKLHEESNDETDIR